MVFRLEQLVLENITEFKEWKDKIEEEESCSFVKKTGSKGENNVQYYQCNRTGMYKHCSTGKRRTKSQGTCKIQKNCTSTIRAEARDGGKILVDVCYTHYGHEIALQHTWLPKGKREKIAAQLQQGITRERILTDIREEAMQHELKRHHLTSKKDLLNIKSSFGIGDVQRHTDDQESVRAWIEEWSHSENNPVLFHKFQGDNAPDGFDLAKEDFMVVLQSPFQKVMAQKFASKGICVDTTHGTTGYNFLLTSLLVVDEYGEGFPIAWCLSNHEDFTHMCIFYKMVKQNCGIITPRWLMSDLASQFYNAWVGIMENRPIRLMCTWHVDKAWQTELRAKVKDTVVAAEIYKMLRTVLQQTDCVLFQDCLSEFLHRLPSLSPEFSQYFERDWVGKQENWAYCYRKGMGINTNMMVEAFHRVFKYSYLKGKTNRRVDNCLVNLMKYTHDKLFDRVIKLTKGKSTQRLKIIQDRHNKSKQLSIASIECTSENSKWLVKCEDGSNTYTISKQESTCMDTNNCQLKCVECNISICVHQYTCSCPDSLIQSTICKHIHLLQRFISNNKENIEMDGPGETSDFVDNEVQLVSSYIQQGNKAANDTSAITNRIKEKLLRLTNQVELCTNKEALQQLDKQLNAAEHLFSSIQKRACDHKLKPILNTPANKNIERQNRFRSTTKKTKNTSRARFVKPTTKEMQSLLSTNSNVVQELLEGIGVPIEKAKAVIQNKAVLSMNDIHLDEEHPPAEMLNSNIMHIKCYLNAESWAKVISSYEALQEEWRCDSCKNARYQDMIMCDSCSSWHHWKCVKIESEEDEWYCQICENLNQDTA